MLLQIANASRPTTPSIAPTPTPTPQLSDAPVTACGSLVDLFSGSLIAKYHDRHVTHFYSGEPFQLVYIGDIGDIIQPQQVAVSAYPYLDGALQLQDESATSIGVSAQDIFDSQVTIPVTFPFPQPTATSLSRPGPYCFVVRLTYIGASGAQTTGAAMSMVEEPNTLSTAVP